MVGYLPLVYALDQRIVQFRKITVYNLHLFFAFFLLSLHLSTIYKLFS